MPLAGGSKAHDEAQAAFLHSSLIRVGYDGRIEQGRRFQRVLPREESPDEEFPLAGDRTLRKELREHSLEISQEPRLDVQVPGVEFPQHGLQVPDRILLAQGEGAAYDGRDSLRVAGDEGPDDDARALGQEQRLVTSDVRWDS